MNKIDRDVAVGLARRQEVMGLITSLSNGRLTCSIKEDAENGGMPIILKDLETGNVLTVEMKVKEAPGDLRQIVYNLPHKWDNREYICRLVFLLVATKAKRFSLFDGSSLPPRRYGKMGYAGNLKKVSIDTRGYEPRTPFKGQMTLMGREPGLVDALLKRING